MAYDIGARLGIEGEKAFNDSLKAVNAQIKALGAEMTAVTASFLKNADSQQSLAAKNEVLNRSIEVTRSKTEILNKEIASQKEKLMTRVLAGRLGLRGPEFKTCRLHLTAVFRAKAAAEAA